LLRVVLETVAAGVADCSGFTGSIKSIRVARTYAHETAVARLFVFGLSASIAKGAKITNVARKSPGQGRPSIVWAFTVPAGTNPPGIVFPRSRIVINISSTIHAGNT